MAIVNMSGIKTCKVWSFKTLKFIKKMDYIFNIRFSFTSTIDSITCCHRESLSIFFCWRTINRTITCDNLVSSGVH